MTAVLERAKENLTAVREAAGKAGASGPPPLRWALYAAMAFGLWMLLDNIVLDRGLPLGIMLLGAVFGSFYAITAIGLVLIYRANRVVNFAQAEFGSVAAVLAIEFVLQWHFNYFLAIFLGLVIAAAMGAVLNTLVIRRFRNAPRLILSVATIGLAQILAGLSILIPLLWEGLGAGRFATPFEMQFEVFPVIFNGNHVLAMIAVPALMAGLIAFLRFSDYGVAIRAASENADRAGLLGIPVPRLSTIVWAAAALLSATAVLLRVPIVGFASFNSVSAGGPQLLLRTLAAAVIGRMESLPRTVVAAIAIGVFESSAVWQTSRTTVVDAMLMAVILIALLVQRDFFSRAAETGISTWKAIKEVRPIPREMRKLPEVRYVFGFLKVGLFAFAATLPLWARPSQEEVAALVLIYAIVAASLLVLTGWAGHISLGQFALVGFGGATVSLLYGRHGWDFFLALPAGIVVAGLVALIIGLPALRIKGPFLAVTTLAFATTSFYYFLEDRYFPWFIEPRMERPTLWNRIPLTQEWHVYMLSLVGLLLVLYAVRNLRVSHTGRALIAVRDNETNAEAVTLNATRLKLTAFLISGAIAGFAGGLYVLHQKGLNTDSFGPNVSLRLFTMVVIGGLGSLPGVILGAVYVRGAEFFLPPAWSAIASGTGILLLLMFMPQGLGGVMYGLRDEYLRRVAKRRKMLVPSLVADRREITEDQAELLAAEDEQALEGALGGLERAGSTGPANGQVDRAAEDDSDTKVPTSGARS